MIKFELNDKDTACVERFVEQHRITCKHGSAGDQFEYSFLPTGLGQFVTVECCYCGKKLEIDCDGKFLVRNRKDEEDDIIRTFVHDRVFQVFERRVESYDGFSFIEFLRPFNFALKTDVKIFDIFCEQGADAVIEHVKKHAEEYNAERDAFLARRRKKEERNEEL